MVWLENVDSTIEFLCVELQVTPGTEKVAADPGLGSQLTPVPFLGKQDAIRLLLDTITRVGGEKKLYAASAKGGKRLNRRPLLRIIVQRLQRLWKGKLEDSENAGSDVNWRDELDKEEKEESSLENDENGEKSIDSA